MKAEILYKKLDKINTLIKEDNDVLAIIKLSNLMDLVREEIRLENCNKTSEKKKLNAALKFLKQKSLYSRPVLQKSDVQIIDDEEIQVFTDGVVGFYLKNYLDLPQKDMGMVYPNMKNLLPNISIGELIKEYPKYNDVQYALKTSGIISKKDVLIDFDICRVSAEKLKIVYDILGTDSLEVFVYGEFKPILFVAENGNKAILLPVR